MVAPLPPRVRREVLPPEVERWLHGQDRDLGLWIFVTADEELAALWRANADRIVAEHVRDHPGRPARWWQYDAPEQRQRLGGIGDTLPDAGMAHAPRFKFGLPVDWRRRGDGFSKGVPIDVADPPRFESEATYLRRLGLLLPGEAERLSRADFRSVRIRP